MNEIRIEHNHPAEPAEDGRIMFQKLYYTNFRTIWKDFRFILSNRKNMRDNQISPAFRERLMLTVTEVNNCRYCRAFHVKQSIQAGISKEEIRTYLSGLIPENIPNEQKLAVDYAKLWADSDARPDPGFQDQLREIYGNDGFEAIELILRMIRMGNLLGNTWDYFLYRISFRKWI
jgi:AhpD family alkylhydroperoxidase